MQNSVVMFTFLFLFQAEIPFSGKFGCKIQNWLFKVKFGIKFEYLEFNDDVNLF